MKTFQSKQDVFEYIKEKYPKINTILVKGQLHMVRLKNSWLDLVFF